MAFLVNFAFPASVHALTTIPYKLNFQGRLTDASGNPMAAGTYNMKFRIYDASSGGTLKWSEQRANSASTGVTVTTGGLFSVQLGDVSSLPANIFSTTDTATLYFEIELPTPATATCTTAACEAYSEGPMSPRNKLGSSSYAFNSDTLDGLDSTAFAAATGSANYIQNGSSPQTANFNVTGTGTAALLQAATFDRASAGTLTIGGTNATSITMADSATLSAGLSLTLTGGNTASRPGSPVEGMVYYDTDTKQLLTYANGKWQADRSDAVLVAASNSSAADKAAADYVADGNTAAANDGDQVQINNALTAGSGKKVVLLAGTYTLDAAVSVPNNTTLAGVGDGSLITVPNSFNASIGIITNTDSATGTGVTVRDLKIDGNKANQTSGTMRGVYFNNMGAGSGASARPGGIVTGVLVQNVYGGNGVLLENTHNTVLTATVARLNSASGINIDTSNNNRITANQSQGNGSLGINLATASNNTITGNMVDGNTATGISMGASSDENTVSGNTVFDNASHGISSAGSNTTVTGNTVGNNTGTGIFFSAASGGTITSNVITASGNRGINISSSSNVVISSNQISGSVSSGMYLSGSTTLTINANRVHDNSGAANNNGIFLTSTDGTSIYDNLITDTACGAGNTCSAININDSTSDNTYLSGNTFTGDGVDAAIINDVGTGTIYAGQAKTQGGLDMLYKQAASASAFQITNAASAAMFTADTSNSRIQIGASATDSTGIALVLDNYDQAGDPTGIPGAMYYNTNTSKFRCYQGAAWADCITAPGGATLQTAYTASTGGTTPEIKADATRAGFDIQDADTTIAGTLFAVRGSNAGGLGTALFDVSSTGAAQFTVPSASATAFTLQTAASTKLFVADSTSARIYIGGSAVTTNPITLVLSNASSASDPTGVAGSMYYSTAKDAFRCYEAGIWRNCIGNTDSTSGYRYANDLLGSFTTTGDVFASSTGTGAATATSNATIATNRPGTFRSTTGTTTTGRAAFGSTTNALALGGGLTLYETAVNVTTLSDATNRYSMVVGFYDSTTANQVDAVSFVYDEGGVSTGSTASANWQVVTSSNSTRTWTTTTTAVGAGTWVKLGIIVNAAGTSVGFYINGTLVATHTANIPTGTARALGFGSQILKSVGTTARTVDIDYLQAEMEFTTPR